MGAVCPLPQKAEAFGIFSLTAIFLCILINIANWAQPKDSDEWPCHSIIQLTPSLIYALLYKLPWT